MNTQEVEVTGGEQVGLKAKWISLINAITTFRNDFFKFQEVLNRRNKVNIAEWPLQYQVVLNRRYRGKTNVPQIIKINKS